MPVATQPVRCFFRVKTATSYGQETELLRSKASFACLYHNHHNENTQGLFVQNCFLKITLET